MPFFVLNELFNAKPARYVFPQAPKGYLTVDKQPDVTSWYDVLDRSTLEPPLEKVVNVQQIKDSANRLIKIAEREIDLLKGQSQKLFIGGMSQGAAMAMATALQLKDKIGGIMVCSGYYFDIIEINKNNLTTPLVSFHGTRDSIRPWEIVKVTYDQLKEKKPENTEIILIDMDHESDVEAIRARFHKLIMDQTSSLTSKQL